MQGLGLTIPAIHGTITVSVPVERAFRVFTDSFGTWWPPQYHIGQADVAEAVLELREGGRWYERGVDGSQCDWGRVLAWEPPHRLVVTWQINGEWQYDPDPDHASEIEVRFIADGPGQTTVELEHRLLERCSPSVRTACHRIDMDHQMSEVTPQEQLAEQIQTTRRTRSVTIPSRRPPTLAPRPRQVDGLAGGQVERR